MELRRRPNVMVTGTPGTGKTTLSYGLAASSGLHHIDISRLVKEKNLESGHDDEFNCAIVDEDRVCDEIDDTMKRGGNIVDYHGCGFFPETWFDRVVVLRTDNTVLYDRLIKRGYSDIKLRNNLECEIFQMLLEEAMESFPEKMVFQMQSNSEDDLLANVNVLADWVHTWPPPLCHHI